MDDDHAVYPSQALHFEEALQLVGTGRFQWLMLLVCGLANAADATEILSVSLVSTAAEKALNLTPKRQGALNACVFLGMFLGGLSWGLLGDKVGRRRSLLLALLINALFGMLSAASHNLGQLVVLRLLAGLGVGGSMPVVFAQLSELCPSSTRGKWLAMLASCWMLGSLYSASLGWLVIPTVGWRAFIVVASLPAWACSISIWLFMPESPRYLLVMGRVKEATEVLERMAATNGRTLPKGFALQPVDQGDQALLDGDHHDIHQGLAGPAAGSAAGGSRLVTEWHNAREHLWNAAQRTKAVMRMLLTPPLRACTLALAVGWAGLCGGWYCTVLWLPRYFEVRGAKGASIYAQTLFVSLANLPGNVVSVFLVDRLGRRWTACICMAGACICALAFGLAPAHGAWPTVAACVFNGVSVGGWNSLDMISSELYPTTVRSRGLGLLNAVGRVSSFATTFAAGALLEVALWAPLVSAALLLGLGSAAMLALPEPAGKPLEDTLQECAQHAGGDREHAGSSDAEHDDAAGGSAMYSSSSGFGTFKHKKDSMDETDSLLRGTHRL